MHMYLFMINANRPCLYTHIRHLEVGDECVVLVNSIDAWLANGVIFWSLSHRGVGNYTSYL